MSGPLEIMLTAASVITVVGFPLIGYLVARKDSELAELKTKNSESHGILHRKLEEAQARAHALEVACATQAGQLRELEALSRNAVQIAEFERALGPLREDLAEIKRAVMRRSVADAE